MVDIVQSVNLFNKKQKAKCDLVELNELAEHILCVVMDIYSEHVDNFIEKHSQMTDFELKKWVYINEYFCNKEGVKLLDCAFGGGRDLAYAWEMGYDVYGCDLNEKFYENLLRKKSEMQINVVCADIRNLPYSDAMFDIVRHNASFLHMPLIGRGYTIDKCIEESYRVLKKKGVIYILTKYGEGYECVDTGDGMGTRPFQFINEEIMENLLYEHGFNVLHSTVYSRWRNAKEILWLEVIAQKN